MRKYVPLCLVLILSFHVFGTDEQIGKLGVELDKATKKLDSVVDTYSAILVDEVESVKDSRENLDERYQIEKEDIYRACEEKIKNSEYYFKLQERNISDCMQFDKKLLIPTIRRISLIEAENFIYERDVIVDKLNLEYMDICNALKNTFYFYCQTYNALQELKSLGNDATVELSVFHQRHIETMHKIIFNNPADFDPVIDDMCHELDIVYGHYEYILDLKKEIAAPSR